MNKPDLSEVEAEFTKGEINEVHDAYARIHEISPYDPVTHPKGDPSAGPRPNLMKRLLDNRDDA
ncbi:hypothetical protein [Streptomyces sp. NPDC001876]|uniref:hypothetical protein n=1 Tax=Streptomyces sp. NPDC001876 TaxID=3154402 RepID=UPI00332B2C2A